MFNLRMPAHAEVVVGAPHCDVPLAPAELLGRGEGHGAAVHALEHPVRVVQLLLQDLILEEALVREACV